jgi:hypothetical protein
MWIYSGTDAAFAPIYISPGNYSPLALETEFVNAMVRSNINATSAAIKYNPATGVFQFNLDGLVCSGGTVQNPYYDTTEEISPFTITTQSTLVLFNPSSSEPNTLYVDQTLGWRMGFRSTFVQIQDTIVGDAVANITGTRYIMLRVNDFNNAQVSDEVVGIATNSEPVRQSRFGYPSGEVTVRTAAGAVPYQTMESILSGVETFTNVTSVQSVRNEGGNALTQSQVYAMNELSQINATQTRYRTPPPTEEGVMAIIPVLPNTGGITGGIITSFTDAMQKYSVRRYFGPVSITRMRVSVIDETGNALDFNGRDWNVAFIADKLYQY